MNDNPFKLNIRTILLAVMAALLIYAVIINANQASEIEWLQNRINNQTSELNMLRSDISSIYRNVDEKMKKSASLLTVVDYTFGDLDTSTHTVDVVLKVVPKTLTDNMTLSVKIGDSVAEFNRNGTEFTASIPVNMFMEYGERLILYIESEAGTQTEVLEDVDLSYLYDRYLPYLTASVSSNTNHFTGRIELNSHLRFSEKPAKYGADVTFVKYELVTEVGGREIEREDLTAKVSGGTYSQQIRKTINATAKDSVVIYIIAEDSLGYIHKEVAFTYSQSDSGVLAEAPILSGRYIYDKEGNLLTP